MLLQKKLEKLDFGSASKTCCLLKCIALKQNENQSE